MTSTENRIRVGRSISTLVYPPCFSYRFNFLNNQLNMNARMQKLKTSPLIRSANQWTGFYMITAPAMKELKEKNNFLKIRPLDLEKKMIAQLRSKFSKIPMNAHTTISVIHVTLLIRLHWSVIPFWGVVRNNFLAWMFFNAHNKGITTKVAERMGREHPAGLPFWNAHRSLV